MLTVYLEASRDTLTKRMERPAQAGKYKGTLEELQADFDAYGEVDLNIYDVVFNSEQQSP